MTISIYLIFNSFKINSYISYYIIQEVFILLMAFSNFVVLYLARIFLNEFNKENEMDILFEKLRTSNSTKSKTYVSNQNISSSTEQEINSKNDQIIELNAAVYTLSSGSGTFNYYVDSFNEYSKNNNLNITIKLE
ncbi:hypothetical protein LY90DRAFT_520239 [Neocallimastix californiae]|uniref:Uncharacterized protein n=1 Tax=Neocallimastix californiae TaxID=1754190 RepID=A0A1Y1YDT8_9FUNG|nr:hypothetical protein LY90DRAFT_520239 [Neocallimastix californiae]|eukprot:ORX96083.1 hypothetical protein LY90DRAFT_520239 [Neocallimastix californiae]